MKLEFGEIIIQFVHYRFYRPERPLRRLAVNPAMGMNGIGNAITDYAYWQAEFLKIAYNPVDVLLLRVIISILKRLVKRSDRAVFVRDSRYHG